MSEQKHTAGPWEVYDSMETDSTYGIDGLNGEAVVWYGYEKYAGIESSHDAQLIATAPELLQACKTAKLVLETSMDKFPDTVTYLEDIIAQAERG